MKNFIIREAVDTDAPALARVHVKTFGEAHGLGPNNPTHELREHQWRDTFRRTGGNWFCFVIVDRTGGLVGFAKGVPYLHEDQPGFSGELNKIYLLREFHRRGLGRRLVGHVARRFLCQGVSSMLLFGDAQNPSNGFYEALGAERLLSAKGEFHGGYGWRDLQRLASVCPVE